MLGTDGDEGLRDKGLVDAEARQQEDCWPESVVLVIACYHPGLGRCDDVMGQTDAAHPAYSSGCVSSLPASQSHEPVPLKNIYTHTHTHTYTLHTYLYTHTWASSVGLLSLENTA